MNFNVLKSAHMEPNTQNTSAPISDAENNTNTISPTSSPSATPSTGASSVPLPKAGSLYFNNSIFWIEVEKIVPNPYQPRREFDPYALKDLSESIRMYGLLQPLVVTRREIIKEDGGLAVQYELISGERRLRASKLAGLIQVPVIIRAGEEDARVKLELAIIENLQREDLNAVDRARSFQRLADEFGLKHAQIAEKMGKSREYVTNSIRLLSLPEHMLMALSEKKISEGHTRPLLMLVDRPEEQETLFKEIVFKKITVREAESIARRVAVERTRKKDSAMPDPEIREFETKLNQALGTRVMIEKREQGGKVVIDFFNNQDLRHLLDMLEQNPSSRGINSMPSYVPGQVSGQQIASASVSPVDAQHSPAQANPSESTSPDFTSINSIASALNAMGSQAHNSAGDSDIVKLIHTEMEPKELGLNSFEQGGLISHIEPSMNTENLQGSLSASIANVSGDVGNLSAASFGSGFASTHTPVDDSVPSDAKDDEDLYSIKNFSI
jgi:ParB family chromosome partitioning protein